MTSPDPPDPPITQLLHQAADGDEHARDELFRLLYRELRAVATARLRNRSAESMEACDLVHEMYARMFRKEQLGCANRRHFFSVCGRAMQDILVERARRRGATRHGGGLQKMQLDDALAVVDASPSDFLLLSGAISRLADQDPETAELVRLRYFVGLTGDETARMLDISPATVDRRWDFARAWLFHDLYGQDE